MIYYETNSDPISYMIALANVDNIQEIPLNIEDKFKLTSTKNTIHKIVTEMKSFMV